MDETNPTPDPSHPVGRLAHRMNNAVAYVVTNLNLLMEDLETRSPEDQRLMQLVVEANAGANRIAELIRDLKVLSWGDQPLPPDDSQDDTWDEDRRPKRILVIDDEPYILAAIRRALRHYDVQLADGGQRAISLLEVDPNYDLILCDLIMGGFAGADVYKWVVTHQPQIADRVIFMTAGAFTGEVRDFLKTVENPVLHKPFDTKTLRWLIAQTMRRARSPRTPTGGPSTLAP